MNVRMLTMAYILLLAGWNAVPGQPATRSKPAKKGTQTVIALPKPQIQGGMSLSQALAERRSIRQFARQDLQREQIAQLCWAGQGITHQERGYRTAPSAGALYPLRLMVATAEGLFAYLPKRHALEQVGTTDIRSALETAALHQECVGSAGAVFVVCGDISITAAKYRARAERYVWIEAGHVGQNILLQATALGLGAVPVGAFEDAAIGRALHLSAGWRPLYILPVGVRR